MTRITDASGTCLGEEQTEKEEEEEEKSSVDGFASYLGVNIAVHFVLLAGVTHAARLFGFISASL